MRTPLLFPLAFALLAGSPARGFPPAPHHTLFGVVKNQLGTPLATGDATIILSGPAGEVIRGRVDTSNAPGINYALQVAQDSNKTAQLYTPTAMLPTSPYSIRVVIGSTSYLPIQMQGQMRTLGDAGKSTRLDLTLGEDTDGDGLPDAWERDMIDFDPNDGINDLSDVNPNDDTDRDGMKNFAEYIAGTYAFDRLDALKLEVKEVVDGVAHLEFVTITGRTYRLTSSEDGETWTAQPFSLQSSAEDLQTRHRAEGVTLLQAYVPAASKPQVLFRLHVE